MNRLIKSSKFWSAVIGFVAALLTWKITNDVSFAMYTSGLFGLGIVGNTAEDMMFKQKEND